MPALRITAVDGREIVVKDSASLEAEIEKFERALQDLVPDLENDDDVVGNLAIGRYRILAFHYQAINNQLDWWNEQAREERRKARRALATKLKERRAKA